MDKYGMSDDGGVQFFRFVVNPKSFGQTVENLFYTSFLIRDGSVAISKDSNMLPTLRKSPSYLYLFREPSWCYSILMLV